MLNETLKTIRKQKGMSQEIMAQQLNVVRQTVSKWERGLSVPDAEMLGRIAELFDISVSRLLGEEPTDDAEAIDTNEIAAQLAILNEQLARRNRRNKNALKAALIVIALIIIIAVACPAGILLSRSSQGERLETAQTVTLVCTLDGEEYIYSVTYDDQYRIIEAGGNAYIADHAETETAENAADLIARVEEFFLEQGGTCEQIVSTPPQVTP